MSGIFSSFSDPSPDESFVDTRCHVSRLQKIRISNACKNGRMEPDGVNLVDFQIVGQRGSMTLLTVRMRLLSQTTCTDQWARSRV